MPSFGAVERSGKFAAAFGCYSLQEIDMYVLRMIVQSYPPGYLKLALFNATYTYVYILAWPFYPKI